MNNYKIFLEVAHSKTLTEASEKLHISVPGISRSIKELERRLGIELFYRENGMTLTAAGKELCEHVEKGFLEIDLGEKLLLQGNSLENGEIVIGCPSHITSFYLMKYVEKVSKDYPKLKIKIHSGEDAKTLLKLLDEHRVDFIIDSTHIDLTDKHFIKDKIKDVKNIFISKEPLKIDKVSEIEKYKYILPFENTSTARILKECLNENKAQIIDIQEMDITEIRVLAAKNGIGIGYVMEDAVKKELENGELYEVKMPFKLPISTINLIYLEGQLTKADKEFIKQYLKK